jgi:hypothetical protein
MHGIQLIDPNGARDNDNDHPIRVVLSSYYFPANGARGIPDGLSDCTKCKITCDGISLIALNIINIVTCV